ncbi:MULTISPECIES: aldehyde dehydrogenase family protein [unclassified Bradyrhizobium]|uniref:aldehyde dehydrogenase family protein n=1 Tax=unclassified Bradyrhizobium TaxID=2631580 RepID=UPI0028EC39CF|nr:MULTISPECIES: aldehyde dehydrogenase family protein [unclassified Bradyrhizobium]
MADAAAQRQASADLPSCQLLINGLWADGERTAAVFDKYRLQPAMLAQLPSREQVRACVAAAEQAFQANTLTPYERGVILDRAAAELEKRAPELVEVLRQEAGFPRRDAVGELQRCVATFRLSAEEARRLAGEVVPMEGAAGQKGRIGFTIRVPLGVVVAITPFNAPLNTVAHKVAPALAAGNALILKPSLHTPMTSCIMAECLVAAGLPSGLMSVLHGDGEVADWLLSEPNVKFFAFTGSTEIGRIIQSKVGLRRTQMELGSISHCVICADADLDVALPKVVNASFRKAGQVCTSIQVLLVQRALVEQVEQRLTRLVAELPYGDPGDDNTVVGPVVSEAAAQRIESWIAQAEAKGARRLVGGTRKGAVVPPTLLTHVDKATPLGCQEVFGPVLCIEPFDQFDDALARVNGTPYGLATGIFTKRLDTVLQAARQLQVGGVHINETPSSRVDMMPYGGSKDSGFGREGPHYAIREMSEERMVTILA